MDILKPDFYCYECYLQFDSKNVFNVHLTVVHREKLDIKEESYSQFLVVTLTDLLKYQYNDVL